MSLVVEPICSEIEYTFLGIAVANNCKSNINSWEPNVQDYSLQVVDEGAVEMPRKPTSKAWSRRRTTRALARKLVKGVFQFPLCCRPSTLGDGDDERGGGAAGDEFTGTELSKHLPYAPRKVTEASKQLVPHQEQAVSSPHLPHVQRKVPPVGSQLQRKVIVYPPKSGSMIAMNGQWKIGFENVNRWESPLQGWSLTGDAYSGVGEPGLDFDSREDAIAYAQKYGWSYRVEGELVKHRRSKSMGAFGWVELMRPAVRT